LSTGLHQYAYNLGPSPVTLGWICDGIEHGTAIEPEESFYIKPHITHWFENVEGKHAPGRVLLFRVGGKIVGDTALEASIIGKKSLGRVVAETMFWYNAAGSHTNRGRSRERLVPRPSTSSGKPSPEIGIRAPIES